MNKIKCPHCQQEFQVDESDYAKLAKRVRDAEFAKDLHQRLEAAQGEKETAIKLAEQTIKNDLESKIIKLEAQVESFAAEKKLAIQEAVLKISKDRDEVVRKLERSADEKKLQEVSLTKKHEAELKSKDEIIDRYKDMKAKLSTKMVGETLEQHCEIEFNRLRSMAFPRAYFEKDNDASGGSKGDYIYRELDENGQEIISIMFEMKNEADETASKKKNEDFLTKLDRDRQNKNCEYAVLVSLLEADNELYNSGILNVSYKYPKMYVIRPQFFITIIALLREAALNSMKYKSQLARVREENIDITNFEESIEAFKSGFARNYNLAKRQFETAIEGIDKTITQLQKTKDNLLKSENNLRLANKKAEEDLTIKRLTYNNPTMKVKFDQLKK